MAASGSSVRLLPTLPSRADRSTPAHARAVPSVAIVIPARDEAPLIANTLRSLLAQDYDGPFRVVLVDDGSSDGTAQIAAGLDDPRLTVISGAARPAGWSGKLWAVQQGVAEAGDVELLLLTDADIVHGPGHLTALVAQAERLDLDLVSEMVELACESWAERALVPAFVFFFQLLYPFAWVNDGLRGTAAAAGGTILIRQRALQRIDGVECVRDALIDDVALAAAVKKGGRIWLGHATLARSVRPYPRVADVWRMVTRTAYVQLRYSPLLLVATTLAMLLTWIVAARRHADRARHGVLVRAHRLDRACHVLPANASPLRPVATLGAFPAAGRGVLHGRDDRCRRQSLPRPRRRLERPRLSGGRAMNDLGSTVVADVETWSGKDRGDENFPVGSKLIQPKYRQPMHCYYAFAATPTTSPIVPASLPTTRSPGSTSWKTCCSAVATAAPAARWRCARASPKRV